MKSLPLEDALNDYEMLAMTGESYIMSNAISALKKKLPEKKKL